MGILIKFFTRKLSVSVTFGHGSREFNFTYHVGNEMSLYLEKKKQYNYSKKSVSTPFKERFVFDSFDQTPARLL